MLILKNSPFPSSLATLFKIKSKCRRYIGWGYASTGLSNIFRLKYFIKCIFPLFSISAAEVFQLYSHEYFRQRNFLTFIYLFKFFIVFTNACKRKIFCDIRTIWRKENKKSWRQIEFSRSQSQSSKCWGPLNFCFCGKKAKKSFSFWFRSWVFVAWGGSYGCLQFFLLSNQVPHYPLSSWSMNNKRFVKGHFEWSLEKRYKSLQNSRGFCQYQGWEKGEDETGLDFLWCQTTIICRRLFLLFV